MTENPMRMVRIEKVTLNFGIGETGEPMKRAEQVVRQLVNVKPIQTKSKSKIPTWGIREGLPIGLKVTLRGTTAMEFLGRAFAAVEKQVKRRSFDDFGNFGFGVKEYIDLPGVKYDPKLGIMGFDVLVTVGRPGYRVKQRRYLKHGIGKKHVVSREDSMDFVAKTFGVEISG